MVSTMGMRGSEKAGNGRLPDSNTDTTGFSVTCDLEDADRSKIRFTHRIVREGVIWGVAGGERGIKYLEQAVR